MKEMLVDYTKYLTNEMVDNGIIYESEVQEIEKDLRERLVKQFIKNPTEIENVKLVKDIICESLKLVKRYKKGE